MKIKTFNSFDEDQEREMNNLLERISDTQIVSISTTVRPSYHYVSSAHYVTIVWNDMPVYHES